MFKTSMCKMFLSKGKCSYGKACRYAHASEELRPSPLRKTQLCRDIFQPKVGRRPYCSRGESCQNAHTEDELREVPAELAPLHWKRHPRKSQFCKDHKKGFCSYGHFCWLAHEKAELVEPVAANDHFNRGRDQYASSMLPIYRILEQREEEGGADQEDQREEEDAEGSSSRVVVLTEDYQGFQGPSWDD